LAVPVQVCILDVLGVVALRGRRMRLGKTVFVLIALACLLALALPALAAARPSSMPRAGLQGGPGYRIKGDREVRLASGAMA